MENNVPKPTTNLNPFSRRVSRTHMVTITCSACPYNTMSPPGSVDVSACQSIPDCTANTYANIEENNMAVYSACPYKTTSPANSVGVEE